MAYTYANLATLKLYIDFRQLVQLTNDDSLVDDSDASNINEDILEAIENDAATTIDNYFRNIYLQNSEHLTGAYITPEIKRLCAQLTHIGLQYRRGAVPEETVIREERIRARLKNMASSASSENREGRLDAALPKLAVASGNATRRSIEYSGLTDVLDSTGSRIEDE